MTYVTTTYRFIIIFNTYELDIFHNCRYGALSFGLVQKDVPENFGLSAPPLFKGLAVRNVAKVSHWWCIAHMIFVVLFLFSCCPCGCLCSSPICVWLPANPCCGGHTAHKCTKGDVDVTIYVWAHLLIHIHIHIHSLSLSISLSHTHTHAHTHIHTCARAD